jgi:hypothetical protein
VEESPGGGASIRIALRPAAKQAVST